MARWAEWATVDALHLVKDMTPEQRQLFARFGLLNLKIMKRGLPPVPWELWRGAKGCG